jgi:superfamily I DNA and RNA helicase
MQASLTITEKSERIRGLAGSGKTVLLAMKAAKLHKRFPNKKIAYVFYTKSLYSQTIGLIRKYYIQIADDEPNWDNLLVLHSWGGTTTGLGFYSYICQRAGRKAKPFNYRNFDYSDACRELIEIGQLDELFDYVLVDEAQDFPLEFFALVEKVAKKPKKVVIAYDELQTTNDVKIPEFEELFGSTDGVPNIPLESDHDYILKKSYRNTLDVLLVAFSFGFGFYHSITQIIQDKNTWKALGFDVNGEFVEGNEIEVLRPKENSPNSIQDLYKAMRPVNYEVLNDGDSVVKSVSTEIARIIREEKVNPEDILVIDVKMNREEILNKIQSSLYENDVDAHIPGVVTDARDFFLQGMVTLTTPRNAKGNEVPVVFVVGCEDMYEKNSDAYQRRSRNFLFISMTRSKGWVYLYAAGRVKTAFMKEINAIRRNIPHIRFVYPSEARIKELAKIDYITSNPNAQEIDNDLAKLKTALKKNRKTLQALLDLDPELKASLIDVIRED